MALVPLLPTQQSVTTRAPEYGPDERQLGGLLFCDRRGIGQQYAALAGYPIVCISIGLDTHGTPSSLSLQQTALDEGRLIRCASAVGNSLVNARAWWAAGTDF